MLLLNQPYPPPLHCLLWQSASLVWRWEWTKGTWELRAQQDLSHFDTRFAPVTRVTLGQRNPPHFCREIFPRADRMIEVDVQLVSLHANQSCTGSKIWHSGEVTPCGWGSQVLGKVKTDGFDPCVSSYPVPSSFFCLLSVITSHYLVKSITHCLNWLFTLTGTHLSHQHPSTHVHTWTVHTVSCKAKK